MKRLAQSSVLQRTSTRIAASAALVAALTTSISHAQYDAANWTHSISPSDNGTTDVADVPTAIFSYDVNLGNPGGPVSQRTATFSNTASGSGTVTFQWYYTGFHAFFQANIQLQVFANTTAGGLTVVDLYALGPASQEDQFGIFYETGTASIEVEAGMEWGIITGGGNNDSDGAVNGKVHIVNLVGPVAGVAGFESSYSVSNWTSSGITGGTTDIQAGSAVQLSYNVFLGCPGSGVPLRTATFSCDAAGTGNARIAWVYSGLHNFFMANNFLTLEADTSGGTETFNLKNFGGDNQPFLRTGVATVDAFQVEQGMPFRFLTGGSNLDSESFINGKVTLIVAAPPVPPEPEFCEADFNMDSGVNVNDLLGFLGFWFPQSAGEPCP